MSWIYWAIALFIAYCEENPEYLARLGLEFQVQHHSALKQACAKLFRLGYIGSRFLHEKIHSQPPKHPFDTLASIAWLGNSQSLNEPIQLLKSKVGTKPTWESDSSQLLKAYKSVFPNPPPTGRKLGKGDVDWVALGFQGANPFDDFRGSGSLGLEHYVNFCTTSQDASRLVKESGSIYNDKGPLWYSLALASIHISYFLSNLMVNEPLYIACVLGRSNSESSFDDALNVIHNKLLVEFHNHWLREQKEGLVKTVMDTDQSLKRFDRKISAILWQMN